MPQLRAGGFTRRAQVITFAACFVPWVASLGFSGQSNPMDWTIADWTTWRDQQIRFVLEPTFAAGNEKVLDRLTVARRSAATFRFIRPYLDSVDFKPGGRLANRLGNFVKFVQAARWLDQVRPDGSHSHALGMDVLDSDYWECAQAYTSLPPQLANQKVLTFLERPETYASALQEISDANTELPTSQRMRVALFSSQFIAAVDRSTYGRLLVIVPNKPLADGRLLDQWISFAIAVPNETVIRQPSSISVVAVVRDESGEQRPVAYFTDFVRTREPPAAEIGLKPTFVMRPNPSQNCYDCHKSAVLPIHPKATFRMADGKLVQSDDSDLNELNQLATRYGPALIEHQDVDAYGPSIGSSRESKEFVRAASGIADLAPASIGKVRDAMACATCHDRMGKLNYLLATRSDGDTKSFRNRRSLVQSVIEQGIMPPGSDLTATERHVLWECVSKAYLDEATCTGTFVDWLRGQTH